ncbi:mismatch-specific DNA-glycosylase [Caulobacter sp. 17J65-9]|uniref:mismatch-specific DNA-glycosylase n=1 Tax=Caulobacter sp. 17J65-9 TaxID=2709382 RepID=UPI0013C57BD0|nr:mismatch-specific DNA-glycosylase [Caulobacter sp. 17J65-9]NEX92489.1 mismatch-specific DNA-glycosylase [Caulobacter sp. 17J65-9]
MRDLLREGLQIVFCGTAKGAKSAATATFYADGTNRFYRVLHEVGLTDRQIRPENFSDLLSFGIGLTDLNQIESGTDRQISMANCDISGFSAKIAKFKPRAVAFTSKMAAKIYFNTRHIQCGLRPETLSGAKLIVLPSTSGLNGHWSKDQHHWRDLPSML